MPTNKRKTLRRAVEEWWGKHHDGEGRYLPMMLQVAVPLWMMHFRDAGPETRADTGEVSRRCLPSLVPHRRKGEKV